MENEYLHEITYKIDTIQFNAESNVINSKQLVIANQSFMIRLLLN
jgi:hypothetical protein